MKPIDVRKRAREVTLRLSTPKMRALARTAIRMGITFSELRREFVHDQRVLDRLRAAGVDPEEALHSLFRELLRSGAS